MINRLNILFDSLRAYFGTFCRSSGKLYIGLPVNISSQSKVSLLTYNIEASEVTNILITVFIKPIFHYLSDMSKSTMATDNSFFLYCPRNRNNRRMQT